MKEVLKVVAVVIAILLLRIGLVNLYEAIGSEGGLSLFDALGNITDGPLNLVLTVASTIILGLLTARIEWIHKHSYLRVLSWVVVVAICASLSTIIAASRMDCNVGDPTWYSLFFAATILCTILLVAVQLWLWFNSSKRYVSKVLAKSERTQFQYSQLKRQLNPHFLFNSLSILDYLVQEQQTERASDYIKKLANIYRYLLKQEEYDTIELSKEIDFLGLYIDIMRERFLDSFEVKIDIEPHLRSRKVVPCSLQVLVENAFKHNTASPTQKLQIEIFSEKDNIVVRNNLAPKQSSPESNGFGLKNLRAQYKVLSGTKVVIEQSKEHFTVKFPLL
jgi:LytS/YehU family sensor histidine kinase